MSRTEDVAYLLQELGHGVYVPGGLGGSIFLGDLPAEPAAAIAVAPYTGPTGDAKLAIDQPRFQIAVRDELYTTAENRAKAVYDSLIGLRNRPLGSAWLTLIVPVQNEPYRMPTEERGRERFVINIGLWLHQPTVHRV